MKVRRAVPLACPVLLSHKDGGCATVTGARPVLQPVQTLSDLDVTWVYQGEGDPLAAFDVLASGNYAHRGTSDLSWSSRKRCHSLAEAGLNLEADRTIMAIWSRHLRPLRRRDNFELSGLARLKRTSTLWTVRDVDDTFLPAEDVLKSDPLS